VSAQACAPGGRTGQDEAAHRRDANRAVAVSAAGLAVTGLVELSLALLTGSVALLGDAIHNLSDVSTSAVVFLGFRVSKRPPSRSHPYGYERAEDLAGLGVALVVWVSAVFAGDESYRKLAVAFFKRRVGRRIGSLTLIVEELEVRLDPGILVSQADEVSRRVEDAVLGAVPAARQVHAHAHAAPPR
jgi:divalent metal cation (Fe/Co/Zn/Cd) transporter